MGDGLSGKYLERSSGLKSTARFRERAASGSILLRLVLLLASATVALAQGNCEIQTYPSFHGPSVSQGVVFSLNFKADYDITKKINAGVECYGSLGPLGNFDPLYHQEQQIVPAIDLNVSPKWEFNFGVGVGVTRGTDHLLVKMIIGRRFGKTKSVN